jgi:hypothetical protein
MELNYDSLVEKWMPVLKEESAGTISDSHRRNVTAALLENQEQALRAERAQYGMMYETAFNAAGDGVSRPDGGTGAVSNWDPVLISLVRRAMPNLMAYDVCGVQPMTGPTGLIFAMKSKYAGEADGAGGHQAHAGKGPDSEALFAEAHTPYSGDETATQTTGPSGLDPTVGGPTTGVPDFGGGMLTADAEALGTPGGSEYGEMGFTIEKATVTAKSRALKAE